MHDYVRDGAEIYRRSFAIIRAEADLSGLDPGLERTVVRMIHACGMVDLPADVAASPGFSAAAAGALRGARRSSATPRWSPRGSRGPGCPPATR